MIRDLWYTARKHPVGAVVAIPLAIAASPLFFFAWLVGKVEAFVEDYVGRL